MIAFDLGRSTELFGQTPHQTEPVAFAFRTHDEARTVVADGELRKS